MKEIKLFDYQEDMKERIEKALRLHRSVMAQMPTGTGKTVLLASVVESFLREHSNCNVWIVAHRRELVSQIRETIQRVFSKTHPQWSLHPLRFPRSRGTETSLTIKEGGSKIIPSFFTIKEGFFRKPTRPSLPLRKAPPLFSVFSPQGRRGKPPSGAQNRYAIRLTDQSGLRHFMRDGTAWGGGEES